MTDPTGASSRKPGDFPIGSVESRAAARMLLGRCNITAVIVSTGLPLPVMGPPVINPPDTLAYYLAPDKSIVGVICREHEAGKFVACIHQTWSDGGEYRGNHLIADLGMCRGFAARNGRGSNVLRNSLTTMRTSPRYPLRNDTPKPGDFELGSLQSRSAARALLEHETADDEQNRLRVFVEMIGRQAILQVPTCCGKALGV
jgi:hypothetical protein